jgi:hypothetical protein
MTKPEHVAALVAEVEEAFEAAGYVGLYEFSWSLRGLLPGLEEQEVMSTSREAFERFVKAHEVRLVWVPWPVDLDRAVPASSGTPVEFDLDRDAAPETRLLALVPAEGM